MADQGKAREPVWASAASLALLGPMRLSNSAGDGFTPKARKSRALLAVVALAGTPVARSRLGNLLWGDRGEEQAKASLRQALYELRPLADSGALCADRQTVSLNRAKLPTDLSELERGFARGDFAGVASALERVQWPLLSDLDDLTPELDEWLRDERARISSAIVHGAAGLAQSALEASQPAIARRIADAAERIDPLDECLARLGARADLALGDRAAAHRRVGRAAARLKEQLGIDPAPETRALLADEAAGPGGPKAPQAAPAAQRLRWRGILAPALILLAAIAAAIALYLLRPASVEAVPTIAVLPFEQIGQKQDYFASGVSDEILNLLSHQRQMRVLGRISAAEVGDRSNSMEIARKLGISHLVDGSVRTSGDRVLVIVRMTRVADGAQLWSERYERQLGDIFAVQKDIASAVASRLARSIGPNAPQATSPDVYDRYLAARQLVRERRELPLQEADRLLREAIRLDPGYAPAHAELSQVIMLRTNHPTSYGSIPFVEARAEAERLAKRAIELDPNLGDAHAAMGFLSLDHDRRSAPYFRQAVALSPQRPEFHRWYAQTLFEMERYDEAIREYERAVAIDPLWSLNYDHLIGALYLVGREREGQALARRFMALSTDPHAKLQLQRQMAKLEHRSADELRINRALYKAYPDERQNQFGLASALGKLGERREAQMLMRGDPLADAALSADWPRLAREARSLGRGYWDFAEGYWNISALLVASGHSDVIVELYDQARPLLASGQLEWDRVARPMTILALRKASRGEEADRLLSIFRETALRLPNRGQLGEDRQLELMMVAALSGRDEEAIRAVDRWSRRRPVLFDHNPAMSLRHYPVFARLVGHPRFAEIDERMRRSVNGARRQAGLPPIDRETWISDSRTLLTKN